MGGIALSPGGRGIKSSGGNTFMRNKERLPTLRRKTTFYLLAALRTGSVLALPAPSTLPNSSTPSALDDALVGVRRNVLEAFRPRYGGVETLLCSPAFDPCTERRDPAPGGAPIRIPPGLGRAEGELEVGDRTYGFRKLGERARASSRGRREGSGRGGGETTELRRVDERVEDVLEAILDRLEEGMEDFLGVGGRILDRFGVERVEMLDLRREGREDELFQPASDVDEASEVPERGLDVDGRTIEVRCRSVPGEVGIRRGVVGDGDEPKEGSLLDEGRGGESSARAKDSSGAERLDALQSVLDTRDDFPVPFQLLRSGFFPPSPSLSGGLRSEPLSWLLRGEALGVVFEEAEGKP